MQKYYCNTLCSEEHYVLLQTESVIFFADSLQTSFWLQIFDLTVVRITWTKHSTISQMEISLLIWFSTGNSVLLIKKKNKLLYHCLIQILSLLFPICLFRNITIMVCCHTSLGCNDLISQAMLNLLWNSLGELQEKIKVPQELILMLSICDLWLILICTNNPVLW